MLDISCGMLSQVNKMMSYLTQQKTVNHLTVLQSEWMVGVFNSPSVRVNCGCLYLSYFIHAHTCINRHVKIGKVFLSQLSWPRSAIINSYPWAIEIKCTSTDLLPWGFELAIFLYTLYTLNYNISLKSLYS